MSAPATAVAERPCEVVSTGLATEPDPVRLLELFPSEPRFLVARPADGFAVAAAGEVRGIVERGPGAVERGAERLTREGALPGGLPWVGGFAFDPATAGSDDLPGSVWIAPAVALWMRDGRASLLAAAAPGEAPDRLRARLDRVRAALERRSSVAPAARGGAPSHRIAGQPVVAWRRAAEATLADIAAGRLEKLVLARACEVRSRGAFEAGRTLRRLAAQQPGAAIFCFGRGGSTMVGATPELLARVRGRELETAAVAGTAPVAARPERLLGDAKERREHELVVRHLEARLGPLSEHLEVAAAPAPASAGPCRHLRTAVRARLRPGVELPGVVSALHPTPAVAGLPVDRARAAIAEREPVPRGWYAGGVGWVGRGGGEVLVALRGALLRGDRALLHAGAGLVAGSDWERELEETRLKMQPMLCALLEV